MRRSLQQQKGRTRIAGSGKPPKKYVRVAVSYKHKQEVIRFYEGGHSMDQTVNHFFPGLQNAKKQSKKRRVYAWLAQRSLIEAKCVNGSGSQL